MFQIHIFDPIQVLNPPFAADKHSLYDDSVTPVRALIDVAHRRPTDSSRGRLSGYGRNC